MFILSDYEKRRQSIEEKRKEKEQWKKDEYADWKNKNRDNDETGKRIMGLET